MTRNWRNQSHSPIIETKTGNKQNYNTIIYKENVWLTECAALSKNVATQLPKSNINHLDKLNENTVQKLTPKQVARRTTSEVPHWNGQ